MLGGASASGASKDDVARRAGSSGESLGAEIGLPLFAFPPALQAELLSLYAMWLQLGRAAIHSDSALNQLVEQALEGYMEAYHGERFVNPAVTCTKLLSYKPTCLNPLICTHAPP